MRTLLATLALTVLVACAGKASEADAPEGAAKFVNATCPVMEGDVDPDVAGLEWNDHMVGFCCGGCSDKFAALSDEEKLAKLKAGGADI